jgi:hypothetical protein
LLTAPVPALPGAGAPLAVVPFATGRDRTDRTDPRTGLDPMPLRVAGLHALAMLGGLLTVAVAAAALIAVLRR